MCTKVQVSKNKTQSHGGGGITNLGTLYVTTGDFSENTAKGRGGGIWSKKTLKIDGITFSKNTSEGDGGGLFVEKTCTLSLRNAAFRDNKTNGGGGGFYLEKGCTAEITDLTVTGNKAGSAPGGGIWTASNNMFIASCDIRDNVGFSGGGGIYVGEGGILNFMSTCVVKDNRTTYYTNNVTLAATGETAGKWAFISASGLASGSSIGINNQSATVSTPQVRNIKESQTGYFFSDEGQTLEFRKTGEGMEIYMATAITPFSYAMYVLIGLELVGAAFVLFTVIRKRSKRKEEGSDEAAETA